MYTARDTNQGGTRAPVSLRSELAYVELKNRLLDGEFRLNARLGEERLASLLGVSRTPVREVLARLHSEGLVVRGPDGGFVPALPDPAGFRHLYEVRIGLELQGLGRPQQHGTRHDLDALAELRDEWVELGEELDPEPDPSFVYYDESFHVALADAAGNPVLADMLGQVNDRIRVVRMQDFLDEGRIEQTIDEHLGLLDAVIRGDLVDAEALFSAHLERSLLVVEERVARAIARMAAGEGSVTRLADDASEEAR